MVPPACVLDADERPDDCGGGGIRHAEHCQQHRNRFGQRRLLQRRQHINLQLERDVEAAKRGIVAQVLFNADGSAAKVFIAGHFDRGQPLKLSLLHPTRKADDHVVDLKPTGALSGDKVEYAANLQAALPNTAHWYVRVEDNAGVWRVEEKWRPSQGGAVDLKPKDNVLVLAAASSAPASASAAH